MEIKSRPLLKLFPNYFKRIGIGIIILTAVVFVYLIVVRPAATQQTKDKGGTILHCFFLFGLLLIAIARENYEDDRIQQLRLKTIAIAFVFSIGVGILEPFVSSLLGSIERIDALELVDNMLIFYLVLFYILKGRRG